MSNPRLTKKDKGLIKGSMRRVFSRSDLRKKVMDAAEIKHHDPKRPRVGKWVRCAVCKLPSPKYLSACDHISPVVPIESSIDAMGLDETADRIWCVESNLQAICKPCHDAKSKKENSERRTHKSRLRKL